MIYGGDVSAQTKNMLLSVGMGFIFGIIYDIFRIIRLSLSGGRGKVAVFVQDVLFFLLFSGMTFAFCLSVNEGELRFYIVFIELLGFLIYYFSFGVFVIKVSDKIIFFIKRVFSLLVRLVSLPISFLLRIISLIFSKISFIVKKSSKKTGKYLKFHLQNNIHIVYNTFGKLAPKKKKNPKR